MPAAVDSERTIATGGDDLLRLLLGICEDFFAQTGSATRDEVDALMRERGITGGPGWLIDMLGLTRARLDGRLSGDDL
ncbi:hypothetical protein [Actinoplanes sp. N902-109]|uniref:hypothetical protein n=1 Tax=Actinoplanes sp. (strain N902-109) TaxID=649831 RepID=UPI00032936EF|nr:hypothetical protein [Actinoplanes sp. N902-109]AGL17557.1 hypothetical protein L083_4047 [Actinoplanes sp. N902-109]